MIEAPRVRQIVLLFAVGFVYILLAACAHQPPPSAYDAPGFFSGLLHGVLLPFSLIGSIFMDIRVYAFPNSGFFYDLGFFSGVAAYGGGAAASR